MKWDKNSGSGDREECFNLNGDGMYYGPRVFFKHFPFKSKDFSWSAHKDKKDLPDYFIKTAIFAYEDFFNNE